DLLVAHVLAVEQIGAVAVAVHARHRHAAAQATVLATQLAADGGLGVELVVVAHRDRTEARGFGGQAARDVLDRAADGVLAVQRALRAAQYFDALDVEHVEQRTLRPCDVDIVQVDAHARVHAPQRIGLADAADVGGDGAGRSTRGVD